MGGIVIFGYFSLGSVGKAADLGAEGGFSCGCVGDNYGMDVVVVGEEKGGKSAAFWGRFVFFSSSYIEFGCFQQFGVGERRLIGVVIFSAVGGTRIIFRNGVRTFGEDEIY